MTSPMRWIAFLLLAVCTSAYSVEVPLEAFVAKSRWSELGLQKLSESQRRALAAEFQRIHLEGYASGAKVGGAAGSPVVGRPAPPSAENPAAFLSIRFSAEGSELLPYIASTHPRRRIAYVVERREQGKHQAPVLITGELEPDRINTLGEASYPARPAGPGGKSQRLRYQFKILSAQFVAAR